MLSDSGWIMKVTPTGLRLEVAVSTIRQGFRAWGSTIQGRALGNKDSMRSRGLGSGGVH